MIGGANIKYLKHGLENIGKNLKSFRYLCYGGTNSNIDISVIAENCPNVETLAISGNFITSNDDFGSASFELFPHLSNLQINTHAFIPYQVWAVLLGKCEKLIHCELT